MLMLLVSVRGSGYGDTVTTSTFIYNNGFPGWPRPNINAFKGRGPTH